MNSKVVLMLLSAVGIFVISLILAQTVRGFSVEFALFWLVIALASLLAAFALALIYVLPRRFAGGMPE